MLRDIVKSDIYHQIRYMFFVKKHSAKEIRNFLRSSLPISRLPSLKDIKTTILDKKKNVIKKFHTKINDTIKTYINVSCEPPSL